MPLLQRSCRTCVEAKRRCDLSFPSCGRCEKRGVCCEYVNLPIASVGVPSRRATQESSAVERRAASYSLQTRIRPPLHVAILKTRDQTEFGFLKEIIPFLALKFATDIKTPFLHPHLYGSSLPHPLRDLHAVYRCFLVEHDDETQRNRQYFSHILRSSITRLLRETNQSTSFMQLLAGIQALMLIQCAWFLDIQETKEADFDVESVNNKILALTHRLWNQAPIHLPSDLTSSQGYLLAESVRRTVIISNILYGTHSLLKRGYAVRTPFVDSLPFDTRTWLWESTRLTEGCLEASCLSEGSHPSPIPPVVSLHEYTELLQSGQARDDSLFARIVFAACKGKLLPERVMYTPAPRPLPSDEQSGTIPGE